MKTFAQLLLATAAAIVPAAAHAQDDEIVIADLRIDPNDIVVVASGVEQRVEDTGRAVTVIDRAEIDQRQTVVLSDLLATTPGVGVTRNGGPGAVTAVRIRGAEDAQTLVLIDGVRANDPSSPAGAFDFGNLLTGSIQRVEVLRGANSVVWGSQAIGGVVNVVTQAPADGLSARANAEYGYADQIVANGAIAAGSDHVQGALTAGYFRTDGVSQAAVGTEPDGYRQYNASGRLKAELRPGIGAEVRAYYANSRTDLDGFPPPNYAFSDTAEYSTAKEFYGYAGVFAKLGPVDNHAGFSLADIDRDNFDPTAQSAPLYLYRGRSERFEYRGDAALMDQLRFAFGAERETSRFFDGDKTYRARTTSFYGQAIVTPIDAVTLTAGVRNDDHSRFGNHASWGASAAVRASDTTLLRASYNEGFKAPTLYQLFAPFYGYKDLRPETAKAWDAGIEQRFLGGKVRVAATWFHRDTRNQIDFDLVSFTYRNIARARAQGVELELAVKPIEALTVTANYTYTDTENRSAGFVGNDLARRPRDTASVSADYRLPFGLSLGGAVTMVGDSFNDAGNLTRIDGYAIGSIRAEMPIGERFSVYGRIENVTDEKYEVVSGYGTYGRAAYAGVRLKLN
ncbi:TonB-dependent receptor [Sphingomonas sp.]|uniref:TonB-dependent receptor plug domain-containing protein n=1 Tax=Sphingomonas sp. TaxID=28214 RepID=UPI001B0189CA|nr:TonB-dependent receptor [Sphingomonas sp.]MBO9714652.1 TonB-dependent receptor [Sphingomonas sp.]